VHTEDEAKAKWCPHQIAYIHAPHPETKQEPGKRSCITTHCMAWRWRGYRDKHGGTHYQKFEDEDPRVGYCGLSGEP
jgi:hypothetical protein